MSIKQNTNRQQQLLMTFAKPSYTISSQRKKKRSSSDEDTNEEEFQMRKQLSLRLYQGIKQLQQPKPEIMQQKTEQSFYSNPIETHFSLNKFKPPKPHIDHMPLDEVKQLISKIIQCCQNFVNCRLEIQSKYLSKLEKKISHLQNKINSIPLEMKSIQNKQSKLNFQENQLYERQIAELHLRTMQLERQINETKIIQNQTKMSSLKVLPLQKISHQHYAKSLPQNRLQTLPQDEELQQRSLLQGIDEDLSHSGFKEMKKNQSIPIIPIIYSDNLIPASDKYEDTIKKKHHTMKSQSSLLGDKFESTHKKPKQIGEDDARLMSFAKNHEIMIVQQELFSELSNSAQESDQQKTHRKLQPLRKPKRQISTKINPQKSLKFQSPSLIHHQTLQYSPHQQSQVQEFPIVDSKSYLKRLSISKKSVPTILDDQQVSKAFALSKEEKYLLDEIKVLRKIVQWDDGEIVQEEIRETQMKGLSRQQKISKKEIMSRYETIVEELKKYSQRQIQLVNILKKTKVQLGKIKNGVKELLPCQYCQFKNYLTNLP